MSGTRQTVRRSSKTLIDGGMGLRKKMLLPVEGEGGSRREREEEEKEREEAGGEREGGGR